jgi:hypothetical protein
MRTIEIVLPVLLLSITAHSTFFFLKVLKVKLVEWLCFNACAPSNITFLIGFLLFLCFKNRIALHIAILPMFFFGFLGMFVFPWKSKNLIPQLGHIIMTLNIGWTIYITFITADYKTATIGTLLGIVLFSIFISFQQLYVASHPQDLKRILHLDLFPQSVSHGDIV